jgi:hypothetical protein
MIICQISQSLVAALVVVPELMTSMAGHQWRSHCDFQHVCIFSLLHQSGIVLETLPIAHPEDSPSSANDLSLNSLSRMVWLLNLINT